MAGTFTEANAHSTNGAGPRRPDDLPRGLVTPPTDLVARQAVDRARFAAEVYTDAYAKRILDDWTLTHYFAGLEVAYRSVPEGIEVLAIGAEEIGHFVEGKSQNELLTFMIKEA